MYVCWKKILLKIFYFCTPSCIFTIKLEVRLHVLHTCMTWSCMPFAESADRMQDCEWNCSCPLVRVSRAIGRSCSPPRWENWSWPRDCPVRWDCNVRLYVRAIRRVTNAVAAAAIPRAFHGTNGTYIARLHSINGLSRSFD